MKFGIFTSMGTQSWPGIAQWWRHLEQSGWDIACVTDHFMPNTPTREGPVMEAWSTLSALAALVPRITIGTIVLGNTYRHPAVLAKMAAQLDIICDGRLLLGLGAGWQENEHHAYGLEFFTLRERLARLDEACTVLRTLFTQPRSSFDGTYYQLNDAPLEPKPIQQPYPQLMIGGGGEKVTLGIVAKHADLWNVWGGPSVMTRKGEILNQHCERIGRDPLTIARSANMVLKITDDAREVRTLAETVASRMGPHAADPIDTCLAGSPQQIRDRLGTLREAQVSTLFLPNMFSTADKFRDDCDQFIETIAPEFR